MWCAILVLPSQSQHKGSSAPSISSAVVDEERMRPGHWLWLVLYLPFRALTPMVQWQEGHPACKRTRSTNCQRFSSRTSGRGGPEREGTA